MSCLRKTKTRYVLHKWVSDVACNTKDTVQFFEWNFQSSSIRKLNKFFLVELSEFYFYICRIRTGYYYVKHGGVRRILKFIEIESHSNYEQTFTI